MYKVRVKKENKHGNGFDRVKLNIVEQEQLNELVFKFLSADFETRNKMVEYYMWKDFYKELLSEQIELYTNQIRGVYEN